MDGTVSGWITAKLYLLVKKKKAQPLLKKILNRNEAKQSAVY